MDESNPPALAGMRLISSEEINEHESLYGSSENESILVGASFSQSGMRFGRFELSLNSWALSVKGQRGHTRSKFQTLSSGARSYLYFLRA